MIHAHLKSYATALDEKNYRVELAANRVFDANRAFQDEDNLDPSWMSAVWDAQFTRKLRAAGIAVQAEQTVLDVCCGQGFFGEYFARRRAHVTFTDLSPRQLATLAGRLGKGAA